MSTATVELALPVGALRAIDRAGLIDIADKVVLGQRLHTSDGRRLYETTDLTAVGALANLVRERRHADLTFFRGSRRIERPSALTVHTYAQTYGLPYEQVLDTLIDAGLDSLSGGGALIFHPRARRKLFAQAMPADDWFTIHHLAHSKGLHTQASMCFGPREDVDQRLDHLLRLRRLQDETGGFEAFLPYRDETGASRRQLREAAGFDWLRTLAISRLLLDNVPHIQAFVPMLGAGLTQMSLSYGADTLDQTVSDAIRAETGVATDLAPPRLIELIEQAGRTPVQA